MTSTTQHHGRTLAPWPAPGLAWQLRTATSHTTDLPALLEAAARCLEATDAQIRDVDELHALVLDTDHPIAHATLIDHLGQVLTAHPDHRTGKAVVVRPPSLREALADPEDRTAPFARSSDDLEQSRFPMTIISTQPRPFSEA